MKNKISLFTIAILLFSFIHPLNNLFSQNRTNAAAKLIFDSFIPGKDSILKVGVLFELEKDWHIYWRNPGDSGIPTSIEFILPNGLHSSGIQWPVPSIFNYDTEVNFGYENQVMLMSDIFIPSSYALGSIKITAKIEALLCKYICIPFDTILNTTIDLTSDKTLNDHASKLFEETEKLLPISNHNLIAKANYEIENLHLSIDNLNETQMKYDSFLFLPYENGLFSYTAEQKIVRDGNQITLIVEPAQFRTQKPDSLEGILVMKGNGSIQAYEIKVPISH
ncbi:MAG: hypothetical protein HXY50_10065 [Ignavibacteriaceae bacterium]|nr:hypothetical protein [Ignavibacteriaceae bacterium]